MAGYTVNLKTVDIPVVLTGTEARQISEKLLYRAWTEREQFQFTVGLRYAHISAGDVVQLTVDGHTHVVRVISTDFSLPGLIKINGVSDRASLYVSHLTGGTINYSKSSVKIVGNTYFEILDLPALTALDLIVPGYYVAAYADYDSWTGATLYRSLDFGSSWQVVIPKTTESKMGEASSVLAPTYHRTWDTINTVTVTMYDDAILTSDTPENLLSDQNINRAVLGDEIIGFATASLVASSVYQLKNLMRGLGGTEDAIGSHVSGEIFVPLTSGISRVAMNQNQANIPTLFKMVSDGQYLEDATTKSYTLEDISLQPWSVVRVIGERDGSNNLTIDWTRRSRAEAQVMWSPILAEDFERYSVDVVVNSSTVVRTIDAIYSSTTYSASDQTADGITPGDPVTVRVYQISAYIGRGHVTEETI